MAAPSGPSARDPRGTILVVNPNTNPDTTSLLVEVARRRLRGTGFEVVGVSAAHGPLMLVDPRALLESVPEVVAAARRAIAGRRVSGVLVGAIGDPGADELRGELDLPVTGIGEAAVREAAREGRPFGLVTTTPRLGASLERLAARHGGAALFTGIRFTRSTPTGLAARPGEQLRQLDEAVRDARDDGAERIVVAGGPLSATARQLSEMHPGAIVQPVPAGIDALLSLLGVEPPARGRAGAPAEPLATP